MFSDHKLIIKKRIKLIGLCSAFISILISNLIAESECNDLSALNYNEDAIEATDCVYFDIPYTQLADEDMPYVVDLLSFASGSYFIEDFLKSSS